MKRPADISERLKGVVLLDPPDAASGISVRDIRAVVARLRAAVAEFPALAYLLENVPPEYDPDNPSKLIADLYAGGAFIGEVYLGPRITKSEKAAALEAIQTLFSREAEVLNSQLSSGSISVATWEAALREEIKSGHVGAYVAGRSGSWNSITFAEWGRLGSRIKRQYEYLRGFANEIRSKGPDDAFSLAYLNNRANLYGAAMRESLQAGNARDRGLDPSALPAIPGDGTSDCLVNCKCEWSIRTAGRNRFLISWKLGVAEHCKTCIDRANDWVNLEVYKGNLISSYPPHYANR